MAPRGTPARAARPTCRRGAPSTSWTRSPHSFAGPELKPHVVHVNEPFEELKPVVRIDPDDAEGRRALKDGRGKPVMVTGRRYVGPADCPDCRGGLSSRGHDLVCQRVSRETSLRGCHDHCIVACGMEEASDG
jgi:hypothetical protein